MIQRVTWSEFRQQMKRLSFLPGFEKLEAAHWADWYKMMANYFPHEVHLAVDKVLRSRETRFMPAPGVLLGYMEDHRRQVGGRDWDSTLQALEREAGTVALPAASQKEIANV